jgi:hypothetical protein
MAQTDIEAAFARICGLTSACGLPGIETGTSYGTPSLRVQKKFLARLKDAGTLVVYCPLEEKEFLKDAAPDIYFETDHYKGWPGILVRLGAIGDDELRHRIEKAWRMRAGKRLISAYDRERGDTAPGNLTSE